jgi:DNA polymerase-1
LPEWKSIFKAAAGNKIIAADYSQIELRILAQVSQDDEYIRAYNENTDLHKLTASKIFKKPIDEVDIKDRNMAKTVNFGIIYGMGVLCLQEKLKAAGIEVTKNEATEIIKGYFEAYPGVAKYLGDIGIKGLKDLGVRSLSGRLMKFESPRNKKERSSIKT